MRAAAIAVALALLGARAGRAQEPDSLASQGPETQGVVHGRTVIPGARRQIPVAGLMVTLHRVGQDHAGPIDSARTRADGRYDFTYRRTGDGAVYFASAVYRGIAYFSAPLHAGVSGLEEGEITVFDTTSGHVPFTVQGHHVVVSKPSPDGLREVVEVFEVSNDSTVTKVGADSLSPVWSAPVPRGAQRFAGGQGDVAASALSMRDGRALLSAAFGPGVKQLSFSYTLAPSDFPLEIPLESNTSVLEVLAEEETARVSGAGLKAVENARAQGRVFRRFLTQDVPAGAKVTIAAETTTAETRTAWLHGVGTLVLVLMAGALARTMLRKRGAAAHAGAGVALSADRLLGAIAALDVRQERPETALAPDEYGARRAALKGELEQALAGGVAAP